MPLSISSRTQQKMVSFKKGKFLLEHVFCCVILLVSKLISVLWNQTFQYSTQIILVMQLVNNYLSYFWGAKVIFLRPRCNWYLSPNLSWKDLQMQLSHRALSGKLMSNFYHTPFQVLGILAAKMVSSKSKSFH